MARFSVETRRATISAPMPFARLRAAAPKLRTAGPKVRAAAPIPKELREQQVEVWPKRSARLRLLLRRKKLLTGLMGLMSLEA